VSLASGRRRPESSPRVRQLRGFPRGRRNRPRSDSRGRRRRRRDGRRDDTRLFSRAGERRRRRRRARGVSRRTSTSTPAATNSRDDIRLHRLARGDDQRRRAGTRRNPRRERDDGSVSGNTDYLVAGDNPGATKQADARDNDVPILDESNSEALLEDEGLTTDREVSAVRRKGTLRPKPKRETDPII